MVEVKDPLIGRKLGDFVVESRLGAGGFGVVYEAEQPLLGRRAVIKVLRTQLAGDAHVQRFLREAKLASRLDHPYAAHIYASGAEPDGTLWIAMELVRGTPLDRMLTLQGPLPLLRFLSLFEGICEVVQNAHEQGIVHRDLKPANVMVVSHGGRLLPKLLDFGIARLMREAQPSLAELEVEDRPFDAADTLHERADAGQGTPPGLDRVLGDAETPLTEAGTMIGSPGYMAPEQWVDPSESSARTDLYAIGVLAYECLTGKLPFSGRSLMALGQAHATQRVPVLGGDLPAELDEVLARALAKRAKDRFASALELATAFRRASGIEAERIELPHLEGSVRRLALAEAPQPLADAVAALAAARNPHAVRDAVRGAARVIARLLGVYALAAWRQVGAGVDLGADVELVRALALRGLSDAEWLALARALCRPFLRQPELHPVPELVAAFGGEDAGVAAIFEELVEALPPDGPGDLERGLALLAGLLGRLRFLYDYTIAVARDRERAEAWRGAHARVRPTIAIAGKALDEGVVALIDPLGVPVLSLGPLVQIAEPTPGAPRALFLVEGKGRRGARLVAPVEGFQRDDEGLAQLFREILADSMSEGRGTPEEVAPFRGLEPFGPGDAAAFVGREREVEAFVNRLRATPLIAVVGPSGVGKSSFVHAGVLPALEPGWTTITVRPGPAPFAALAARLGAAGLAADAGALRARPERLGELLRGAAAPVALVVDQLEELFTLCSDAEEREAFAAAVAGAARAVEDRPRVIFTLRDDFLVRADKLAPLRARLAVGMQLLGTPARDDLLRIVGEPVRRAGYAYDDPALPGRMVDEVADQPGALALLSFTAARLWELRDRTFKQLRRKAYDALGGVAGALAGHAEETLLGLRAEEQRLARDLFRHLVTADGTRSVVKRSELDAGLVEKLVAARLLTASESETGEERVEIIHEALLSAWPRLGVWRREDAEGLRLRDQLRAAAGQWDQRGRSAGLVWRGDALAEYRLWRPRFPGALTAVEEAFAAASVREDARGRRVRMAVVALTFAALCAGVVFLLLQNRATRARLRQQFQEQGRKAVLGGDPEAGLAYLERAVALGAAGRDVDLLISQAEQATAGEITEMRHKEDTAVVRFSPDGRRILTGSLDQTAGIWDAANGRRLATLAHPSLVFDAAYSPDGRLVATACRDKLVRLWSAEGVLVRTLAGHEGAVRRLAFSPDGTRLASGSTDGTVRLWDVATGAPIATLHHEQPVERLAFAPDGALVATAEVGGRVSLFDAADGAPRVRLDSTGRIHALAWAPGGSRLVIAGGETVRLVDAAGQVTAALPHPALVRTAVFDAGGERMATGCDDGNVRVFTVEKGAGTTVLPGRAGAVNSVRFSPDGALLAAAVDDRRVVVWEVAAERVLTTHHGHVGMVHDVVFDPSGERLASVDSGGLAMVFATRGGAPRVVRQPAHTGRVNAAAFAPDGESFVTSGDDATAKVWGSARGELRVTLSGHTGPIRTVRYSRDGARLLTAGDDGSARVWDARTGAALTVLHSHTDMLRDARFDGAGARVVTAGADDTARVWDVASGRTLVTLAEKGQHVWTAMFDPFDEKVLTAAPRGPTLWRLADGAKLRELAPVVGYVDYDHRGRRILGVEGRKVVFWDGDGRPLPTVLEGHVGDILWAEFSADDAFVITAGVDGTARIWSAATGELLVRLASAASTGLWTATLSPDGRHLLGGSETGAWELWTIPVHAWSARELADLIACRSTLALSGDQLVTKLRDLSKCTYTLQEK